MQENKSGCFFLNTVYIKIYSVVCCRQQKLFTDWQRYRWCVYAAVGWKHDTESFLGERSPQQGCYCETSTDRALPHQSRRPWGLHHVSKEQQQRRVAQRIPRQQSIASVFDHFIVSLFSNWSYAVCTVRIRLIGQRCILTCNNMFSLSGVGWLELRGNLQCWRTVGEQTEE